jgi:thiol-disulfide isomerase/thioredoxin
MVALGFVQSNEYLTSFNQPSKAFKSLIAVVLFFTLVRFGPVTSSPCFRFPSVAQQNGTHAPDRETNEAKAILYFFTAHWCEPCHKVQPFVERLCKKHSKVVDLALIDFDSDRELVESFQVKRIPAFFLLDSKRRLVFRAEDAHQETLEALARAVEKLTPTRKEVEEPEIPHSSTDPKRKTSQTQESERR